ncbi:MAG: malate synthase G [Alphaproteobacteria bacterium]|nr:malate synthase G [Alphaproteobacteria bacterium]
MTDHIKRAGLHIDEGLAAFVEGEALPGTGIDADRFWSGLADLIAVAMPRNAELLMVRKNLQRQINDWHKANGPVAADPRGYEAFLQEIGYLEPEPEDFTIETEGLDPEITKICGPQLVVPVSNARYALNAANARWGSLYDAFYGTDVIPRDGVLAPGHVYNPQRGARVFEKVAAFLDAAFPLEDGSHAGATSYAVAPFEGRERFTVISRNVKTTLKDCGQFVAHHGEGDKAHILLWHNGLHVELCVDTVHPIGRSHPAGLADVLIESAITTIQDCEDSVAAVDAADKVGVYRNWLGLMKGTLEDTFVKDGHRVHRALSHDRGYTDKHGRHLVLKGRSLQLVRNVGHLMTTDMVRDRHGKPVGEGLIDAAVTALCALHDRPTRRNSRTGAIYVVKPKMHGPQEVALACEIFARVEHFLGLPEHTIKIGIMDEERRTSANLKACIKAASKRVFFINTGFLDRTGDEIHTAMRAGPVMRKDAIKKERWIKAYEDRNSTIGLKCGMSGRAQIGKGMWAAPDNMAEMLATKIGHPRAGANTAWVPSPTAATLHALHYHEVDVFAAQKARSKEAVPPLADLFSMPVLEPRSLSRDEIVREVENNAQGILGYVVRWVQQGIGCSKVPDIGNTALMEDRATLRISSQHIANWLLHGVVTQDEVEEVFRRMAKMVDSQNMGDPLYQKMDGNFDHSVAFKAALRLVFEGASQPSGYTEPILHEMRARAKAG